jgi:hypothetical protein
MTGAVMARSQIDNILNNIDKLQTQSFTEDKIVQAAKDALNLLRSYQAGKVDKSMQNAATLSQSVNDAVVSVTDDAIGQDYGPFNQPPAFSEFN